MIDQPGQAVLIYVSKLDELLRGDTQRWRFLGSLVLAGGALFVALHAVSDVGIGGSLGAKLASFQQDTYRRVRVSLVTLAGIAMRMNAKSGRPRTRRARQGGAWIRVLLAFVAVIGAVALVGCNSSKPGYCADRASLENSIKGLTSLNASSGISGLKSQVQMIQSAATTLVNSAKSDFPSETSAITSSVDALKSSVAAMSLNPSVAQIAAVTKDAASMVSSVKGFMDASNSKCG